MTGGFLVNITLNIGGTHVNGWLVWGPEPLPAGFFIPASHRSERP